MRVHPSHGRARVGPGDYDRFEAWARRALAGHEDPMPAIEGERAVTAAVLVVVTIVGFALSDVIPKSGIAAVQAFAGGATLAVLADSLMPEAYRDGGWWVGMATAAGFLVAFALG